MKLYSNHGWWMWIAWGLLSYAMLFTKRYMKFYRTVGTILHYIIGYFITIVTIVWSFKALAYAKWDASKPNAHIVLGLAVFALVFVVAITGITCVMISKFYHRNQAWSSAT